MNRILATVILASAIVCSCNARTNEETNRRTDMTTSTRQTNEENTTQHDTAFALTSPAFSQGESIPQQYACNGEDISPALEWSSVPDGTASFVLLVEDPDAPSGLWTHWVAFDIPATRTSLPESVPNGTTLPGGGRQGTNSSRDVGYSGPCPPSGTHRYFFKLYALDTMLNLKGEPTRDVVLRAIEGHIKGECELMGRYSKT